MRVALPMLAVALAGIPVAACRPGPSFESPAALPAAGASASDPALLAEPGSGNVLATWIAGDSSAWHLFFSRSTDAGATWSAPVRVTTIANDVVPHGEASPRLVAAPGGRLAVIWPRSIPVAGRQWPASAMRLARSLDGGRTWLPTVTLNDDTTSAAAGHNFHGATWVGDSGIITAWLDERHGDSVTAHRSHETAGEPTSEPDAVVYAAYSPDFGRTWAPNRPLWGAACPCCRVALARTPGGGAIAAWRQHYPGNIRDIVVAPVSAQRTEPARVHRDDWAYPGCPHAGPALAIGDRGERHIVWYTGKTAGAGIYYTRLDAAGKAATPAVPLVTGAHVPPSHAAAVALGDGGALAAFDVASDGSRIIGVARMAPDGTLMWNRSVPGSAGGRYPQMALAADGAALIAWTGDGPHGAEIRLARLPAPSAHAGS
jgi:hypothetical protein